ncbi:MAG: 2-C-methyl-D-erythritol 4-phosphate cytidylyltransferase [Verrucomicrobia bacterium]|nr:2-C-methyl-D-erythritol 4-phosphate cytidylyltransferase [Verrucomicrobiota bacterium]NBU10495.1 2-C-methyl-D-erythritol 4-phosphate cytidylyltransferase [Pseudomonadota bacterium]NDA67959.1 2-C-methyl-D-erythritol 4-phosphate cytidylyltransferase [Verrucomicrobiota bacterium]NDB76744.1 2-C-methyl-D-erythritol 4-phosphate cytidylyltransferase [Verrucomicrobiota bacterium]NDD37902.1 2-C-methyl-D-erythritol 4-phosphate cytidylyltransferase [Verrucomicrobiota bacterium]
MTKPSAIRTTPLVSAVIVAAGSGTRMGPGVDKLFLEIAGRPIVAHTWARFEMAAVIDELVLVVRDGMQGEFQKLAVECGFKKPFRLTVGGKERQDSVWNGLQAVSATCELVAIQDGARPCTSGSVIEATLLAARETGAAVAAQRVTDTIKESDGGTRVAKHIDRARLWAVQTPQAFRLDVIRRALAAVRGRGVLVTDDTAACELIGQPVALVESKEPNPKATSPADLPYLELLLKRMNG